MRTLIYAGIMMCFIASTAAASPKHETKIIAHRGHWNTEGSTPNSLASLREAARIGCYGTEFDVHLTADGIVVVHHDNDINGRQIWENTYAEFADHVLENGEIMPTLQQYLEEGAKYPELKLIIEIKSAPDKAHETRSVEVVTALVSELEMDRQVEYIAFSDHICTELLERRPDAKVAYLNGDKTPEELKSAGIPGLDYYVGIARNHPELFESARAAGIYTNVWTVNEQADMRELIAYGVDFLTTDDPESALKLLAGKE